MKTLVRQRSKSTSSSSTSNRPVTATMGNNTANLQPTVPPASNITTSVLGSMVPPSSGIALVMQQPNGICRITRTSVEQEKMPDRINYDRRGLTAVPLFENEPNLRLLSLQHNLINIFHIPKKREESPPPPQPPPPVVPSQPPPTVTPATIQLPPRTPKTEMEAFAARRKRLTRQLSRLNCTHLPFNTSVASPSPPPMGSTSPLATPTNTNNSPLAITNSFAGGGVAGGQSSNLNKRGQLVTQKNLNFHPVNLVPGTQTNLSNGPSQYRFALKKSKSFMMNYSKHFGQLQRNQAHLGAQRMTAAGMDLLKKSFDSSGGGGGGGTSESTVSTLLSSSQTNTTIGLGSVSMINELEEDEHAVQLEIKNRQLQPSYEGVFQHLVFLDLYDNQIERVANLDGLPSLSVLLLGKNRISDISGLTSLSGLRVLDLHGNKLTSIANRINCLPGLRSLNLAGNQIRQINQNDFNGLSTLRELNLKRNRLKRIHGFQHLVALERLWLCHNDLHKVEDMASIAQAVSLVEVTIENNPVSLAGDCVSFLVSYLPRLQSLSQMPITEQVRNAALAWRKQKELSDVAAAQAAMHATAGNTEVFNNIRREEVISNARTNWELLRSQQMLLQSAAAAASVAGNTGNIPGGANSSVVPSNAMRRQPRSPKHRELTKISESNEAVNLSMDDLQEFIKLPPIQKTRQQSPTPAIKDPTIVNGDVVVVGSQQTRRSSVDSSSGSSLGPNVDSSSSCFSSDNEEESSPARVNGAGGTPARRRLNGFSSGATKQRQQRNGLHTRSQTIESRASAVKHCEHNNNNNNSNNDTNNNNSTRNGLRADQIVITTTPPETTTTTSTIAAATTMTTAEKNAHTSQMAMLACPEADGTLTLNNAAIRTESPTPPPTIMPLGITDATLKVLLPSKSSAATSPTPRNSRPRSSNAAGGRTQHNVAPTCRSPVPVLGPSHNATACNSGMQQSSRLLGVPSPSPVTTMATPNSTNVGQMTCRRYMPGSLMRSQTIVGPIGMAGGAGGGGGNGTTTSSNGLSSRPPAKSNAQQVHSATLHQMVGPSGTSATSTTIAITANGGKAIVTANGTSTTSASSINTNCNTNGITTLSQQGGQITTTSATATAGVPPLPAGVAAKSAPTSEREREQGGDYLIEICGRYLNVYGQGALRFLDKQWNATKAADVHTLNFSYINFNNIATLLGRVKARFPHAEHFVFRETNINTFGQLNALAELLGIGTLFIDPEGNPLTGKNLWRLYAIYRLSHWGLRQLNGSDVTDDEIVQANAMYAGLSELVLWSMPDGMLRPLLSRLRLEETFVASKMSPKLWLMKLENSALRLVVGKEALQWKKPSAAGGNAVLQQQASFCTDSLNPTGNGNGSTAVQSSPATGTANSTVMAIGTRERGRSHFAAMLENTCNAVEKLHMLETLWPSLLLDIVRNTLLDYSQLDTYLRSLMADIMK